MYYNYIIICYTYILVSTGDTNLSRFAIVFLQNEQKAKNCYILLLISGLPSLLQRGGGEINTTKLNKPYRFTGSVLFFGHIDLYGFCQCINIVSVLQFR